MTILNAEQYRVNIPDIIGFTKDKTYKEVYDLIGILAVITNVPIIIICVYIGELYGVRPELTSFIERLMLFYKVDGVTKE